MNLTLRCSVLVLIIGFLSIITAAQTAAPVDDSDVQLWNDVSVTIPISKKVDIYLPFALWFYKNGTSYGEGRAGAGLAYKINKRLTATSYYQFVRSQSSTGVYRTEHRYVLRGVYKFPTRKFGLSHRSQFEFRDRRGSHSVRYRPSITIEKKLPEKFGKGLKVFATDEIFYDSVPGRFSRNRFSVGVNKALSKKLSVDLYYLRQDDSFFHPGVVHVIGANWKVKL